MEAKEIYFKRTTEEIDQLMSLEFDKKDKNFSLIDSLITLQERRFRQMDRMFRLFYFASAFHAYHLLQLSLKTQESNKTWQQAESTADLINMLIPKQLAKPEDFIKSDDEKNDKIISLYEEYQYCLNFLLEEGFSKEKVECFCKKYEDNSSIFGLNSLQGIQYKYFLYHLCTYFSGKISKNKINTQLQFVSLSTFETEKTNLHHFRNACIEMENIINSL